MKSVTQELMKRGLLEAGAEQSMLDQCPDDQSRISWLLEQGVGDTAEIASCLADHFRLPLLDIRALAVPRCPIELLDESLIRRFCCLPILLSGKVLLLAVADPCQNDLISDIKFHTGKHVELVIVEFQSLRALIDAVLLPGKASDYVDKALHEEARSDSDLMLNLQNSDTDLEDKPLVRFVNRLLSDAVKLKVSDLHFEPYETYYRVRFRRDGQLYEVARPPLRMAGRLASRLKVMAQLNTSERRIPQDGRIRWQSAEGKKIDFRLNVLPTLWGEKLVLRNLDTSHRLMKLDGLGLGASQLDIVNDALHRSQGLILVTGPTGSGKTQTLYTAIHSLNIANKNIATVEDPVEFNIDGVNQVAVHNQNGLTFARALRAFLRQDPDILMVGEIRDAETAEIAIKAAQTGHLVLASLHTNDALGALDRLANMGVAPYNLAAACSLLVAQRLLRKLCEHCKEPLQLPDDVLKAQGFDEAELNQLTLFQASGCKHCQHGYKGRIGIYEVVPVFEELSQLIMAGQHGQSLTSCARANGYPSMRHAALTNVGLGISSLEEANRLT